MTPDEQRIAIAEACGWTDIRTHRDENMQLEWLVGLRPNPHIELAIPDYLSDLNAMHEAEKTLASDEERRVYLYALSYGIPEQVCDLEPAEAEWKLATAEAAQRAEAFLRTKGLWK